MCAYDLSSYSGQQINFWNILNMPGINMTYFTGESYNDEVSLVMFNSRGYILNNRNFTFLIITGTGTFSFNYILSYKKEITETIYVVPVENEVTVMGLTTIMLVVTWFMVSLGILLLILVSIYVILRYVHSQANKIESDVRMTYETEAAQEIIEIEPTTVLE